ncbi:MAG: membrane dipeptidase [Bacteroidaceae bacterium]|nr:membrane dipeptidase [Bacteroidaceae bacterium]
MAPLIAITGNYSSGMCTMLEGYFASVVQAGGSPVIVPPYADEALMESLLEHVDGLILSGGGDIDPHLLGEKPLPQVGEPNVPRDAQELPLVRMAVHKQIPLLGICRGIQVLTAALGGRLWQDIYVQGGATLGHDQSPAPRHTTSHTVAIQPGTLLAKIFAGSTDEDYQTNRLADDSRLTDLQTNRLADDSAAFEPKDGHSSDSLKVCKSESLRNKVCKSDSLTVCKSDSLKETSLPVNSFHHQAVREAAPGFRVSALSPDGIIEAVESTEGKPMLGVQWHPECMILGGDDTMLPLFRWLVGEAASFARARRFHRRHLTLDTHCDTPMFFPQHVDFHRRDPRILVNLPNMRDGHLDATIMVAYIPQDLPGHYDYAAATRMADTLLSGIEALANPAVAIARTPGELYSNKQQGLKSIMLGIENGYALGDDLSLVRHFRRRGVVYMTLCHNGNNAICASARPRDNETTFTHRGLSDFGREVVREMNRVGMMVDLSHAAEQSFYDALALSRTPIVCSHSSSRALCNHPRNLTDDQLRALRDSGGVAQVCLYSGFLRPEAQGRATVRDAVRHLLHMIDVAGIDHVGIGTDFDGDGGIIGCADASEVMNLTRCLQAEGLTDDDLRKVWGENFLRVMTQAQAAAVILQ